MESKAFGITLDQLTDMSCKLYAELSGLYVRGPLKVGPALQSATYNSINKCVYFTFREHLEYNITHGKHRSFFGCRTGPGDRPIQ